MSGVTGVLLSYGSSVPPPYVPPTPIGGWDFVLSDVDTIVVTSTWDWDGGTRLDPQVTGPFNIYGWIGSTTGYGGVSPTFNLTLPMGAGQGAYENVDWGSSATAWRSANEVAYEGGSAVSIVTGINFANVVTYADFTIDFPFTGYNYTGQDGCDIELKSYSGGVIQRSEEGSETLISYGGDLNITLNITGEQTSDTGGVILYATLQAVYVKESKKLYLKRIATPYKQVLNTPDIVVTGSRLGTLQFSRAITGLEDITVSISNTIYEVHGSATNLGECTYPGEYEGYELPIEGTPSTWVPNTYYYLFYDIILGWGTSLENNFTGSQTEPEIVWYGPRQWMVNFQKVLDAYPDYAYIITDNYYEDFKTSSGSFTVSGSLYNCSYLKQAVSTVTYTDPPPPYIYKYSGILQPVGGAAISSQTSGFIGAGSYGEVNSIFLPHTDTWKIFVGMGTETGEKPVWTYPDVTSSAILLTQPVTAFLVESGSNTKYNVCWYKLFFPPDATQTYKVSVTATVNGSDPNPFNGVYDAKAIILYNFDKPANITVVADNIFVYPSAAPYDGTGTTVYVGVARGRVTVGNIYENGWAWADEIVDVAETYLTITTVITPY